MVRENAIGLHGLEAESGALSVRGNLDIHQSAGATAQPFGALLVKLGALSVGINLQGTQTSGVLFGAEKWIESRTRP